VHKTLKANVHCLYNCHSPEKEQTEASQESSAGTLYQKNQANICQTFHRNEQPQTNIKT
jgi:hypothetical protein